MKKLSSPFALKRILALIAVGSLTVAAAVAAAITPTYDSFGSLPAATFTGTDIPNDRVAITTIGGVTLGLTATERYANPPVGDNGAGTFYALPGGDSPATYARWNFDFYVNNASGSTIYFDLLFDLNPGVGTDQGSLGSFPANALADGLTAQNSWNLGMGFLGGGFNPSALGEYSFALILRDQAGAELGRSAINVNVGSVPDVASTCMLLGVGLAGIVGVRRKLSA